jgi:hypothetical protein
MLADICTASLVCRGREVMVLYQVLNHSNSWFQKGQEIMPLSVKCSTPAPHWPVPFNSAWSAEVGGQLPPYPVLPTYPASTLGSLAWITQSWLCSSQWHSWVDADRVAESLCSTLLFFKKDSPLTRWGMAGRAWLHGHLKHAANW